MLYVPSVKMNILSVDQLTAKGCNINIKSGECIVRKNNEVVIFAETKSRFYLCVKHKSEVVDKIKNVVSLVNTSFNKRPKVFRSDRGKEYMNNEVTTFFEREGIQIQYTARYYPCFAEAKLYKEMWGEAVSTANYLQIFNKIPDLSLANFW